MDGMPFLIFLISSRILFGGFVCSYKCVCVSLKFSLISPNYSLFHFGFRLLLKVSLKLSGDSSSLSHM